MINFSALSLTNTAPYWRSLFVRLRPTLALPPQNWLTAQKQLWHTLNPDDDRALTDWLMVVFNEVFYDSATVLVRGGDEPEYIAQTEQAPAQIVFAHGYFSSALHELSHWCIAGKKRRTLDDFGYWYCPDGRTLEQQKQFEQVEIRPQAIECLLTLATGRKFLTSKDNLNAAFDTSDSTFDIDVFNQAVAYLKKPKNLPKDAQRLLIVFLILCQDDRSIAYI